MENVGKVDFPHILYQSHFQNFYGVFPALKWYTPDSKSAYKRQELRERHQVSQEAVFNLKMLDGVDHLYV